MTRLFDTALPPIWYLAFWIACIIAVRMVIVNPLLTELKALRTAADKAAQTK